MERHELYNREELTAARTAEKRIGRIMLAVGALGLILCILICCRTTRHNQRETLPMTVAVSTLSGWIVIFLSHSRHEPARARVRHVELMLTGPRERFSGTFSKLEGTYRVKRGVSIRKIRLQEGFHEILLSAYDEKAARLPDEFTGTVETVYDCIVAFAEKDTVEEARR